MRYSRRHILKNTGIVGVGAIAVPTRGATLARVKNYIESVDRKAIVNRAIEAAIASGASYADARLSHNEELRVARRGPTRTEHMAFGVRALYQGYWGFAASPVWSEVEAARLGAAAVAQAKANVLGRARQVELAPLDVSNGHWETPVKDNPFSIHNDEMVDFNQGLTSYAMSFKFMKGFWFRPKFLRNSKAFGSSLGQFTTQILYQSGAEIDFGLEDKSTGRSASGKVEEFSPAGLGFEYFRDRPLRELFRIAYEEALEDLKMPLKPIEPGRHNVLIDQSGVGTLLNQSIGAATEVDRVFGFEANTGGTSYINDPHAMIGTLRIGSQLLNVSCDRSEVGSVGRVRWDDEGVQPAKYELVKNGVLTNLQTNREGASWIKDYYQKSGQEFRSFGSANAPSALDVQLVHKADMHLMPDKSSLTRDDLRESMDSGIELRFPNASLDFQQSTGMTTGGRVYEIHKGKRISLLLDAGMLFRTSELWSNMTQIGGESSVKYYGLESSKGQQEQKTTSAVFVPPVMFKEMTFVDVKRKA